MVQPEIFVERSSRAGDHHHDDREQEDTDEVLIERTEILAADQTVGVDVLLSFGAKAHLGDASTDPGKEEHTDQDRADAPGTEGGVELDNLLAGGVAGADDKGDIGSGVLDDIDGTDFLFHAISPFV